MNGTVPRRLPQKLKPAAPLLINVLPEDVIRVRKRVVNRLPRQANHFAGMVDHFLNVKDSTKILLAMEAHFERLSRYFRALRAEDID